MSDKDTTLILGIDEGDCFYVGDVRVTVTAIKSEEEYHVSVDTPGLAKEMIVTDKHMATIMTNPLVRLGVGLRGSMETARVMIKAPRSVVILREELYLNRDQFEAEAS